MRSSVAEGPLFIVDNSEGGRNGLDYLREWSELASSIDIATVPCSTWTDTGRPGGLLPGGHRQRVRRLLPLVG